MTISGVYMSVPKPIPSAQARRIPPDVVSLVDQLLKGSMEARSRRRAGSSGITIRGRPKVAPLHVDRIGRTY